MFVLGASTADPLTLMSGPAGDSHFHSTVCSTPRKVNIKSQDHMQGHMAVT